MPKSNAVKKAEKLAADKAKGVKNMTLPAMAKTQAQLGALQIRYQVDDWRELLTLMIDAVHNGTFPDVLPVPRHEYKPSRKVLRKLYELGAIEVDPDESED